MVLKKEDKDDVLDRAAVEKNAARYKEIRNKVAQMPLPDTATDDDAISFFLL